MFFIIRTLVVLLFLIGVTGCGGGSTGTDGGIAKRLIGTVKTPEGNPVSGLAVTVFENGDTTITNAKGEYEISTNLNNTKMIKVLVARDEREAQVLFQNPETTQTESIKIDLVLNEVSFEVIVASIDAFAKPASTPTPHQTPVTTQPKHTPSKTPEVVKPSPTPTPSLSYQIVGNLRTDADLPIGGFLVREQGSSIGSVVSPEGTFSLMTEDRTPVLVISNLRATRLVSLGEIPAGTKFVRVELILVFKQDSGVIRPASGDLDFTIYLNEIN